MKAFIILFLIFLGGCQLADEQPTQVDLNNMDEIYEKIIELSESKTCSNSSNWKFTAIGSKPCGGPIGYIAYSNEINEKEFLDLVERYTKLQAEYNQKNNMASDCMYVVSPTRVVCENGKPVFQYD
ncbi:hypothetical protein JYB62_09875 [Algoriphagus lutimaris]|uniref:hypothetical protein n=1 Tax=Algoriphagus lutimaris TaxID=613197 RepID=UPI00196A855A|nr:hypothetical protein [Algoriphagus lutimaris]MBN3520311.1 hypothetical protein [Algoriphagus lutimaris]